MTHSVLNKFSGRDFLLYVECTLRVIILRFIFHKINCLKKKIHVYTSRIYFLSWIHSCITIDQLLNELQDYSEKTEPKPNGEASAKQLGCGKSWCMKRKLPVDFIS